MGIAGVGGSCGRKMETTVLEEQPKKCEKNKTKSFLKRREIIKG